MVKSQLYRIIISVDLQWSVTCCKNCILLMFYNTESTFPFEIVSYQRYFNRINK